MKGVVLLLLLCVPCMARGTRGLPEVGYTVDMIELNEYRPGSHQIILYEWCPEYRRHNVICYMIVHEHQLMDFAPTYSGGVYTMRRPGMRPITSKRYRHTVTDYDPEVENKRLFPSEFRTELKGVPWYR